MHPAAKTIVDPFLTAVDAADPGSYSAVLYGSAARGDYVPERSDVNLMLVFDRLDLALLRRLEPAFTKWGRNGSVPPLIVSQQEWERASDVFPLEITDMRTGYEVLRGSDPIAGLTVRPADLRHALERELRGKLMRLRQGYVAAAGDGAALGELGLASVPTIVVLLRGIVVQAGGDVPAEAAGVVRKASEIAGFEADAVLVPLSHRRDSRWRWAAEDFERYLSAVERAAAYVDNLQPGDAG